MPIIRWNESFFTGNAEFDRHHEYLVSLLNQTYDMLLTEEPALNADKVLGDLRAYAGYHFAAEEQWLAEQGFPACEDHKKEHLFFCGELEKFHKDLAVEKSEVAVEILSFLVEWLTHHILKVDSLYRDAVTKPQKMAT